MLIMSTNFYKKHKINLVPKPVDLVYIVQSPKTALSG